MTKNLLFLFALIPHFLFAQSTEKSGEAVDEIIYILQINSENIGLNNIDLKVDKFVRHTLSGGDSLLVIAAKDSTLYDINPDYIKEITVLKNTPDINRYSSNKVKGIVVIKFKNKDQFLSIVRN